MSNVFKCLWDLFDDLLLVRVVGIMMLIVKVFSFKFEIELLLKMVEEII